MSKLIKKLRPYYSFSKTDIKGLIVLSIIIIGLITGPIVLHYLLNGGFSELEYEKINTIIYLNSRKKHDRFYDPHKKQISKLDSKEQKSNYENNFGETLNSKNDIAFTFDPNSVDSLSWAKTGLPGWKIKMIMHYLERGGHFTKREDVRKIYCLDENDYKHLEHFLIIKNSSTNKGNSISKPKYRFEKRFLNARNEKIQPLKSKNYTYQKIENGFHRPLPQKSFHNKIHINTAGYPDLKEIRDLSYQDIKVILEYRKRNGDFTDIRELKNIGLLDANTFKRISPYLCL